eukprot:TRINITY_DN13672_c0_g1_i1.p1 TRINITY_DN13672_c0_g1~~TRINITY_DN13672_c0_g1_i1.p1  ORF type:complete len:191 (+),score=57.89 TRINITY_DN13672_c0_g1_i1:26-598(+)
MTDPFAVSAQDPSTVFSTSGSFEFNGAVSEGGVPNSIDDFNATSAAEELVNPFNETDSQPGEFVLSTGPTLSGSGTGGISFDASVDNEAYSAWLAEHEREVEQKRQEGDARREALKEAGRDALRDLYQRRTETIENNVSSNKETQEKYLQRKAEMRENTEWSSITELIDFNGETKRDLSRLREVMFELKH